jgi:hypothetical protein
MRPRTRPHARPARWQLAVDDRSYVPVKTEAGVRDLPILPQLRRRLVEHRLASPWTRPSDPVLAATKGTPKAYRNARRALKQIEAELGFELVSHDFRRSLASYLIIAARADEGAVTGVLGTLVHGRGLVCRRSPRGVPLVRRADRARGLRRPVRGHALPLPPRGRLALLPSRSLWTPGQNLNRRPAADVEGQPEHEQGRLPV